MGASECKEIDARVGGLGRPCVPSLPCVIIFLCEWMSESIRGDILS